MLGQSQSAKAHGQPAWQALSLRNRGPPAIQHQAKEGEQLGCQNGCQKNAQDRGPSRGKRSSHTTKHETEEKSETVKVRAEWRPAKKRDGPQLGEKLGQVNPLPWAGHLLTGRCLAART